MTCSKIATLLCLAGVFLCSAVHAFDYSGYQPGDLDEILARPKPATGWNMGDPQKVKLTATLEAYAEEGCGVAKALQLSMRMLPTVYPQGFQEALSMAKCIKVKSPKGAMVSVAIQDKVADFLPDEVPLGTRIELYCVLILIGADGPAMVVSEFQVPEKPNE